MNGASAIMHVQGAMHITQVAVDLFRGHYVSVHVKLSNEDSKIHFTHFDVLQYRASRHSSPLLLIGLRYESHEVYFDEIVLPLPDPNAISALFTEDQMLICTDQWKMTILSFDKILSGDHSAVLPNRATVDLSAAVSNP